MKKFLKYFTTLLTVVAVIVIPQSFAEPQASRIVSPAKSIASLGDSITQAANSCGEHVECPEDNWATGSNVEVDSFALRLETLYGAKDDVIRYNNAKSFTKVSDLANQATLTVTQNAEFVTILSGANDACTPSVEEMTSPKEFRASVKEALQILNTELPKSRIFVASVPNLYTLWEAGRDNPDAIDRWKAGSICQSILDNPLSTEKADVDRRQEVLKRVTTYNEIYAEECSLAKNCLFDRNALFHTTFTVGELSPVDYFHPNKLGQARIAETVWGLDVAAHAFVDRGVSKRSSDDAPIVTPITPLDGDVIYGEEYIAEVKVESDREIDRVYANTQIGGVDMLYDEEADTWYLPINTTLVANGTSTTFSIVAVDEKGATSVSENLKVSVDNSLDVANLGSTPAPTAPAAVEEESPQAQE